jgi:hypothetical protein
MKKLFRSPGLLQREVPEALDRKILLAASVAAARRRSTRRWKFFGAVSGMAAAVALAVVTVYPSIRMSQPTAELSGRELLEISDWTSFEQENYNLSSQLNSLQDAQENDTALV